MKYLFAVAACSLTMTSCSSLVKGELPRYEESVGDIRGPKADLTMVSNHSGALSSHSYALIADTTCRDQAANKQLAQFSWATRREKTIHIPAGEEFTLASFQAQVNSQARHGGYSISATPTCVAAVRFTPIAGEQYIASQTAAGSSCNLVIQNAITKQAVRTNTVSLAECYPAAPAK